MYEPRLPVSGYPFVMLAVTPFVSRVAYVLLIITCLLVIFRFTRLLYKEKNLIKYIYIIILIVTIIVGIYIYKIAQVNTSQDIKSINQRTTQINHEDTSQENTNLKNTNYTNINNKSMMLDSGEYIGQLTIEKIELELRVIEDASDKNMFVGAGHVLGTPYPWQDGNSFIASHNVKNYGLLFNRLDELEIGDKITFTSDAGVQNYKVYYIEIVDGENTSSFNKLKGEKNLSLVTCSKGKRLIVYCEEIY